MSIIKKSVDLLEQYMVREKFRGYDPYDMLKSPFFRLPGLKKAKKIRFLAQQFGKRSPINLRKLLLVTKGHNPVTLGLAIQGYTYLCKVYPQRSETYQNQIQLLLNELKQLIPEGFSGACWGYDFDWQARHAQIPAYQPTVVATGIITNALFECWKITGNEMCSELVVSASQFVLKDLKRTFENETFCFSYSPFDNESVLNASMKGVRLLAQTYTITKNASLLDDALPAVRFVINYQEADGSFIYSKKGHWVDNYHTGYVLDCLDEFAQNFHHHEFDEHIRRGFDFYKNHFFTSEYIPKFYSGKLYPIDCTSAGQSLLTLARFGELEMARKVAEWMINNMQSPAGNFYFRKFKKNTIRTSFMRWSNAWMFTGLAWFLYKAHTHEK